MGRLKVLKHLKRKQSFISIEWQRLFVVFDDSYMMRARTKNRRQIVMFAGVYNCTIVFIWSLYRLKE